MLSSWLGLVVILMVLAKLNMINGVLAVGWPFSESEVGDFGRIPDGEWIVPITVGKKCPNKNKNLIRRAYSLSWREWLARGDGIRIEWAHFKGLKNSFFHVNPFLV